MKNILRRSFIWKLSAGASAALVPTLSIAKADANTTDNPALRAALLEAEKALVKFHQAFEQAMDKGLHGHLVISRRLICCAEKYPRRTTLRIRFVI